MHAHAQPTYAELAPILQARCVMCHSGASAAAGLKLDTLEGLLAGSARGPVVRAGAGEASELVRRLRGTSAPRMPMTGPPFLEDAQIAQFAAWIDAGMPAGSPAAAAAATPPRPAVSGRADIALIERWIADGARDAQGHAAPMPVGAAVRLHGTLVGPAQLDALPLRGVAGARAERARIGGYVEVRGRVTSDGEIEVQRLRGR